MIKRAEHEKRAELQPSLAAFQGFGTCLITNEVKIKFLELSAELHRSMFLLFLILRVPRRQLSTQVAF